MNDYNKDLESHELRIPTTEELCDRKDWMLIVKSINNNLDLTEDDLDLLSKDQDWRVRIGALFNPNATSKILNYLVDDEVPFVRHAIMHKTDAPPEALDKLVNELIDNDISDGLQFFTAICHKNISSETLERFAYMEDIRRYFFGSWKSTHDSILKHPNTPQHVKEYLTSKLS